MPYLNVNGVAISYQKVGSGTPLVLTDGGFFCRRGFIRHMAGALSTQHAVLTWEKRNAQGASEIALSDAASDWLDWVEDLHALLHALDLAPAYLWGTSAGNVVSLILAHRYPEDVKGLILQSTPTDDPEKIGVHARAHYLSLAEVAAAQGMQAAIDASLNFWQEEIAGIVHPDDPAGLQKWVAESISLYPPNREKVLAFDAQEFAAAMRRWAAWLASDRAYMGHLSDEQVRAITCPVVLIPGNDPLHARATGLRLGTLFPRVETILVEERWSQAQRESIGQDSTGAINGSLVYPLIVEAVERLERMGR